MEKLKTLEFYIEKYLIKIIEFIPSLLVASILLIVGLWLIKLVNRLVQKYFGNRDFDPTLEKFITTLIDWGLKIILFVIVVTQLGVESASLIAIIGAGGLAIGLALQGSLSNFAGGILILALRPFRVGDWIEAQGIEGTVTDISIFNTRITTFGNQVAVIPNGKLSNEKIVNYNTLSIRREALSFAVDYGDDLKKAKQVLLDLVMNQEHVLKTEGQMPMVAVAALKDSYVELTLRYWAANEHFWDLRWYVLEQSVERLEKSGIRIPFPQQTIHLREKKKDTI